MKQNTSIKSIAYFTTHTSEMLQQLAKGHSPYILTQNGEEAAVVQHIDAYKKTQETLALLKMLALGEKEILAGYSTSEHDVFLEAQAILDAYTA